MLSFPRGKIMLSNTLKLTIFTAQKFAREEKRNIDSIKREITMLMFYLRKRYFEFAFRNKLS